MDFSECGKDEAQLQSAGQLVVNKLKWHSVIPWFCALPLALAITDCTRVQLYPYPFHTHSPGIGIGLYRMVWDGMVWRRAFIRPCRARRQNV